MSEQRERTSERTSEWSSTSVCILGCSGPQCERTIAFCIVVAPQKKAVEKEKEGKGGGRGGEGEGGGRKKGEESGTRFRIYTNVYMAYTYVKH